MILLIMMKVQESVKMCLNLLERPVSALNCKIFNICKTIDKSLNLLTGLFFLFKTENSLGLLLLLSGCDMGDETAVSVQYLLQCSDIIILVIPTPAVMRVKVLNTSQCTTRQNQCSKEHEADKTQCSSCYLTDEVISTNRLWNRVVSSGVTPL